VRPTSIRRSCRRYGADHEADAPGSRTMRTFASARTFCIPGWDMAMPLAMPHSGRGWRAQQVGL